MGLGHILVAVPDLQQCLHFYRDVLGLRISDYIDATFGPAELRLAFFHCNPRHHSIAFGGPKQAVTPGTAIPGSSGRKRLNHFMIELKNIDDVGLCYDLVKERGLSSGKLGRHTNDHMFSFYMETPSGFHIEYGWGGRQVDDDAWEVQYYKEASIWGHGFEMQPQETSAATG